MAFINPSSSLVTTILREKYYKTENIMTLKAKGLNFLLWKNLLAMREVIEGGSRWRVGNGKKIEIWEDRWLPTWCTFQVHSPTMILSKSATVKELIIAFESEWDEDMIKAIFWEDEVKAILSIHLGTTNLEDDKLIWALKENDVFAVKSAYFVAISRNKEKQGCTSNIE